MADAAAGLSAELGIAEEDRLRARWYSLLARVLRAPPDQACLEALAGLEGDDSDFGQAVAALAKAAAQAKGAALADGDAESVDQEFFDLFIGVGKGELLPYGSYYLSGFLYEKPLARLRGDMRQLGIARADQVSEPEDHIAALMEMMSGLITGAFGEPAALAGQRRFFEAHVGCWAPRFFEGLEETPRADFYKPVGRIGRIFMGIEAESFEMATEWREPAEREDLVRAGGGPARQGSPRVH